MGVLKRIRLIPRKDEHFVFEGRLVKSVHGHGDGVGVGLHIKRSVLDVDLGLPKDEMIVFLTAQDLANIQEAFDVSDIETLKLRKGKGWDTGPRPYDKRGLKVDISDFIRMVRHHVKYAVSTVVVAFWTIQEYVKR